MLPFDHSPRQRHSKQISGSTVIQFASSSYEKPLPHPYELSDNNANLSLLASLMKLRETAFPRLKGRRLVGLFVGVVLLGGLLSVYSDERKRAALDHHRCRYLAGYADHGCSTDPFSSLHYNISDGHLFFPATDSFASLDSDPPEQPHPIHLLIRNAEREWNDKVKKQSKTLKAAVQEYKRRYNRPPPRGFGDWFRFAKERKVQLLDEYDFIYERILPYASVPPDVLRHRSDMMQNDESFWLRANLFTVEVREHGRNVKAVGPMASHNGRAAEVVKLMEGFDRFLPDLNLSMTAHDVPWVIVSGEAKERHREAAMAGKFLTSEQLLDFGDNGAFDGWALMCPVDSPLRKAEYFDLRRENPVPRQTSFISDHVKSMDLCYHPERQAIHGVAAWPGPRPALLFPIFSFTITPFHHDLLLPALEQWDRPVGKDTPWQEKKHDKVVWRGSTTGSDLTNPHMRKYSQRPRLCRLHQQSGVVKVPLSPNDKPGQPGPVEMYSESAFNLAHEYFDFRFQGRALQCGDEEMCHKFEAGFEWVGFMSAEEQNQYKYVIDIDGNGWSGRFHRLMASNALVLKSTIFQEWYSDRIAPWVHYVPVSTDYMDLWSIMAFFKGDLNGRGSHDALAEEIATQGKKWTEEYWRWEDMQAYLFRLLLEYARVVNFDRNNPTSMDYDEGSLR